MARRGLRRLASTAAVAAAVLAAFVPCSSCFLRMPEGSASRRAILTAGAVTAAPAPTLAKRPEGVNRPELLPATPGASTPVVDVARILTSSQEREIEREIAAIEKAAKVRLRVLAQTFPNTPGLAIRDYWKPDARTVIYVHDTGGLGDAVVNFNAGPEAERMQPLSFWRQTQNKFGNKFYIQEHGDGDTVVDVVHALRAAFAPDESGGR
eukprot:TRINITY_DN70110_c0_g1_i1.p2 TRINITY_DN70110_c0_g1~~TRINITY_DN70110_c0_g1_i1.p2  ORF type:complete len:220 (+),score=38.69 TRINITY_DN70110_c0_g1_i1:35-661(+)